jgi:hypothetical protein
MGNEWGKTEGNIVEPVLKCDMLTLVGEEDDGCGRVGGAREKQ